MVTALHKMLQLSIVHGQVHDSCTGFFYIHACIHARTHAFTYTHLNLVSPMQWCTFGSKLPPIQSISGSILGFFPFDSKTLEVLFECTVPCAFRPVSFSLSCSRFQCITTLQCHFSGIIRMCPGSQTLLHNYVTHTHVFTYTHIHIPPCTLSFTYTHTQPFTYTHVCTYTHIHIPSHIHTHMPQHIHMLPHMHTYTCYHIPMPPHIHTYICFTYVHAFTQQTDDISNFTPAPW